MSEELEVIDAPPEGNLLATLENSAKCITSDTDRDTILGWRERFAFYEKEAKRLRLMIEEVMVEYIKKHGDIDLGNGVRYYLSHPKTTKCTDVAKATEAIFNAAGGDFQQFCSVLSSNAIKHGAAKKLLAPKVYGELFEVIVRDKLENDEPAEKQLTKFDERFVK